MFSQPLGVFLNLRAFDTFCFSDAPEKVPLKSTEFSYFITANSTLTA